MNRQQGHVIENRLEEMRILNEQQGNRRLMAGSEKDRALLVSPLRSIVHRRFPNVLVAASGVERGLFADGARTAREFVEHYHRERMHHGLENRIIEPDFSVWTGKGR